MADLTACYFCGAATDVRERSVIPAALEPDDDHQRTVAVCPACDEKLSAVLDPIVAHVTDRGADDESGGTEPGADSPHIGSDTDTDTDAATEADDSGSMFARPTEDSDDDPDTTDPRDDAPARSEQPTRAARGDDSGGFPDGTRQVLRLLQNRDRPIDRDGLIDLATNAYGLGYTQAQEVLEALLDREVLRVRDDGTVSLAERGTETGNGD